MLSVKHYLSKKNWGEYIPIIERKLRSEDVTTWFPYYNELKTVLDNLGLEYEISLSYSFKVHHVDYKNHLYFTSEDVHPLVVKHFTSYDTCVVCTPVVKVTIHYPKIQITNSKKESVEIEDLFISSTFHLNGKVCNDGSFMEGMKTTYSAEHLKMGYVHSHLPSKSKYQSQQGKIFIKEEQYQRFSKFCTGEGPITSVFVLIESHFKSNPIKDDSFKEELQNLYQLWFSVIDTTVKWESLEGTPHYRMEAIHETDSILNDKNIVDTLKVASNYYGKIRNVIDTSKYDFFNEKGQIVKKHDFELLAFKEIPAITPNFLVAYKNFLIITCDGVVVEDVATSNQVFEFVITPSKVGFYFNKNKFNLTVKQETSNGKIEFRFKQFFKELIYKLFEKQSFYHSRNYYQNVQTRNQATIAISEPDGES
jgi:hypothetical protein